MLPLSRGIINHLASKVLPGVEWIIIKRLRIEPNRQLTLNSNIPPVMSVYETRFRTPYLNKHFTFTENEEALLLPIFLFVVSIPILKYTPISTVSIHRGTGTGNRPECQLQMIYFNIPIKQITTFHQDAGTGNGSTRPNATATAKALLTGLIFRESPMEVFFFRHVFHPLLRVGYFLRSRKTEWHVEG